MNFHSGKQWFFANTITVKYIIRLITPLHHTLPAPNEVNLPKGNKIFPADRKLTNILEIFVADDPTSLAFLSTWSEEL